MKLNQIETVLEGETEQQKENLDCWIHYAEYGEENIPNYIQTHEQNRRKAQIQHLDTELKYRNNPDKQE